jgi:hypothetical protein
MMQFFVHVHEFHGREGWSVPLDFVDAAMAIDVLTMVGASAELVEANRPRRRQVDAVFAAAGPADLAHVEIVTGCACGKCHPPSKRRLEFATIRPPAECNCFSSATCTVTPIAEPVTSTEQLAAALAIPPAAVFEAPAIALTSPEAKAFLSQAAPQSSLLSQLADAVAAWVLWMLRVPSPREPQ